MKRKILISEAAVKSKYSPERIRQLIPSMPEGMAEYVKSSRLYLLTPQSVRWLKNHKKRVKMGRERNK